jgi:hypothetical protein
LTVAPEIRLALYKGVARFICAVSGSILWVILWVAVMIWALSGCAPTLPPDESPDVVYSTFDGSVLVYTKDDTMRFEQTKDGQTRVMAVKQKAVCPTRNKWAQRIGNFVGGLISGLFTVMGIVTD